MNDINNEEFSLPVLASNTLKDTPVSRQFKSNSGHGQSFIKYAIPLLTSSIEDVRAAAERMPRAPIYTSVIATLDAEVVALIVLVVCLDSLAEPMNKLTLAKRVSEYLLQEINYSTIDAANPGLIEGIRRFRKGNHKVRHCVDNAIKGGEFGDVASRLVTWELTTKYAVGSVLLESMVKLGLLMSVKTPRSRVDKYTWSNDVSDWAFDVYERKLYLSPAYFPLISEPFDYAISCDLRTRDYRYENASYGKSFPPVSFSLGANISSARTESTTPGMNLQAADALAKVPYQINEGVYETMRELWRQGHQVGNLPSSTPIEIPPYPAGGTEEDIKAWKSKASALHIENAVTGGKRLYTQRQLAVVGGYLGKPMYFLWQADTRGRLYPVATTDLLNPQGSDLAKALLTFHTSKATRLGRVGYQALLVACASHYGIDKVSLAKREQWARANLSVIHQIAEDPLGEGLNLWRVTDSPFQFLAACLELYKAHQISNPEDYVSAYICYQDGKCSGAQHWAALLSDADVGDSVGLTPSQPSSTPPDLYTEVLIETMRVLHDPPKDDDVDGYHIWWSNIAATGKLTRKAVKPPTMTYVYGATRTAWANQIFNWAKEQGLEGSPYTYTKDDGEELIGNDLYKRCNYLAGVIGDVLTVRLAAAVVGMKWIKSCSRAITKAGYRTIRWTTPQGFVVRQAYRKMASQRLDIVSKALGVRVRQSMQLVTDEVDKAKQASALAPNYIHSMDAAHLTSVCTTLLNQGHPLTVIHDSFGCLASDTERMLGVVTKKWVCQYSFDNLKALRDQWTARYPDAKLPKLPAYGCLNVEDIKQSAYAFSP